MIKDTNGRSKETVKPADNDSGAIRDSTPSGMDRAAIQARLNATCGEDCIAVIRYGVICDGAMEFLTHAYDDMRALLYGPR